MGDVGERPLKPPSAKDGEALEDAPALRLSSSPVRCPFCHGDVDPATPAGLAVCGTCLARHHDACWAESGACASCAGRVRLTPPRPPTADEVEALLRAGRVEDAVAALAAAGLTPEAARAEAARVAFAALARTPAAAAPAAQESGWAGTVLLLFLTAGAGLSGALLPGANSDTAPVVFGAGAIGWGLSGFGALAALAIGVRPRRALVISVVYSALSFVALLATAAALSPINRHGGGAAVLAVVLLLVAALAAFVGWLVRPRARD